MNVSGASRPGLLPAIWVKPRKTHGNASARSYTRICCEQATFRLLLAGSYRFSWVGPRWQGVEEVGKVERTYIDVFFFSGR
jgi:hypothetical protein